MRITRPARLVAVPCLALALAAAVAPAASAETQTHRDPRGDTTTVRSAARLDPAVSPAVDVVRITTRYRGDSIEVTLDLADLAAAEPDTFLQYAARIKSPGGDYLAVLIKQGPNSQTFLQETAGPDGRGDECATPGADYDRRGDRVTLSVLRECVGAQGGIRTGGIAAAGLDDEFQRFRADDARRNGKVSNDGTKIKLGGVVRRG